MRETIFISSLPFKSNEDDIRELFKPFGAVCSVDLHADWVEPTYEPYAHVEMEVGDADMLVDALDGKKVGRTYIRVHKRIA